MNHEQRLLRDLLIADFVEKFSILVCRINAKCCLQDVSENALYPALPDKALERLESYYSAENSDAGYSDAEDSDLSWFNAGVRIGVGVGMGMCVGVGIGVGLLVRTYQSTSRSLRRGLL